LAPVVPALHRCDHVAEPDLGPGSYPHPDGLDLGPNPVRVRDHQDTSAGDDPGEYHDPSAVGVNQPASCGRQIDPSVPSPELGQWRFEIPDYLAGHRRGVPLDRGR